MADAKAARTLTAFPKACGDSVEERNRAETIRAAYFSMEVALEPEFPACAAGLGVLADDTLRSRTLASLRWESAWSIERATSGRRWI
jgi:hypothetical protein